MTHILNVLSSLWILVGIALMAVPAKIMRLVLDTDLDSAGAALARILAITLVSLGVAAWQTAPAHTNWAGRIGLFVYSGGMMILLSVHGTTTATFGMLLWPIAAVHSILCLVMLRIFCIPNEP
jgi:hypothetical protein